METAEGPFVDQEHDIYKKVILLLFHQSHLAAEGKTSQEGQDSTMNNECLLRAALLQGHPPTIPPVIICDHWATLALLERPLRDNRVPFQRPDFSTPTQQLFWTCSKIDGDHGDLGNLRTPLEGPRQPLKDLLVISDDLAKFLVAQGSFKGFQSCVMGV